MILLRLRGPGVFDLAVVGARFEKRIVCLTAQELENILILIYAQT